MTDDKRKKLESCFDSLEKIVSLRDTLTGAVDNVSTNLEGAIGRLEIKRIIAESEETGDVDFELKEGLMRLDDTDVEYINSQYTDSLWETMQFLLPHYKTDK
jgi:hypothetical protein